MSKFPKDCSARAVGAEARKLVHYRFSAERWEYREETGNDSGRDCIVELIENEQWGNKKIEGQIKGTRKPEKLAGREAYSFPLEVKTINYALGSPSPFVLFLVDVDQEIVYYLPLQDYFIAHPELFERLEENSHTVNVHIPLDNVVSDQDDDLRQIAKSVYIIDEPTGQLRKITSVSQ